MATSSRRRGDELLESLYDATIRLTATIQPISLTFQQIADEAETSRTVLYRRWATIFDLLQDVYIYKSQKIFDGDFFKELKDNGSFKNDLLQLLFVYQRVYNEIGSDIINNYFFLRMHDKKNDRKPEIHKHAVEKYLDAMKSIFHLAENRGEQINSVSLITLMLPFDLIRIENLIRPGNIDNERLITLVEEILLPVFLK